MYVKDNTKPDKKSNSKNKINSILNQIKQKQEEIEQVASPLPVKWTPSSLSWLILKERIACFPPELAAEATY